MQEKGKEIKTALLTGVSYMLPFVVAGGILIAIGFAGGGAVAVTQSETGVWSRIFWWGKAAFGMMVPVFCAYVAYSIGDKPALAAGLVAGGLCDKIGGGFLAAIVAGIIAGYVVNALKKIPVPAAFRSLLPTVIIPTVSVLIMGFIVEIVIGQPFAALNTAMLNFISGLEGGSIVVLGIVQGAMLGFDLGGPVNKAAYAFACATLEAGNYAPMAANFVASMAPPLAIAVAMCIAKSKFTKAERASTGGCFIGAIAMISEYAIPFAAGNPLVYVPSFMAGSAVAAACSYLFGCTMQAPHGGVFMFALCNKPLMLLLALAIGAAVSVALILLLKKAPTEEEEDEELVSVVD